MKGHERQIPAADADCSPALKRSRQELGASAVEYSILVALIATIIFSGATALGLQLVPGFQSVLAGL